MSKPVFEKPYGPGKRQHSLYTSTPDDGATCEFCGTTCYGGPDFRMGNLLGRQIIMGCCGNFVDELFKDLSVVFTQETLEDLARNPTSGDAVFLLQLMKTALTGAAKTLAAAKDSVGRTQEALATVKEEQ